MVSVVFFLIAIAIAAFVGYNVGGSNIGVAFGPAVGSRAISRIGAAALMTAFFFLGGWTVGRNVIRTLGGEIVPGRLFSIEVSIGVLFFIGAALFLTNVVGVPASTSMTGVGAIVGLGLATDSLNWDVMGRIVFWWVLSPLIAFGVSGVIGRYLYPSLVEWFAVTQSEGSLLVLDRSGVLPRPALGSNTTVREIVGTALVVVVACYTAFSAGASNTANAIAPLVGNGSITISQGVLLVGITAGVGAFTIGRRTVETVGNDLTEMTLLAALVVAIVSSTIVTVLSELGVPVSVVVVATMSIVGLGWGRSTRTVTLSQTAHGELPAASVGSLAADAAPENTPTVGGSGDIPAPDTEPAPIGEETADEVPETNALFQPRESIRVVGVQNIVPAITTLAAYLLFRFVPL